jgi:myo-inositol-1(or 4)-monophosphatase
MEDPATFAIETAKEAGLILRQRLHEHHIIDYKGEIDIVTEADRMSEDLILSRIRDRFPHHTILSEESPPTEGDPAFRWIIDPLDGTTNYAHGFPVFCVSIALERDGDICLGVIYNPMLDEMFLAERGKGAFLNGRRIQVSVTATLSRGLLATGFPYDIRQSTDNNMNYFIGMALSAQAIRRAGSAALDMAYVAAGRFDGFWELKLKPWDTAAGWILILEAGGAITDIFGHPFHLESPHILASNGKLQEAMIAVIEQSAAFPNPLKP